MKEVSLSIWDSCKKTFLVRPHPAGRPFIVGGVIVTLLLSLLSPLAAALGLLFTGFCVYFFRDPVRVSPEEDSLVVSPADGIISKIEPGVKLPEEIGDAGDKAEYTRISIFLSVLDVHVNRVPVAGTVRKKAYKPGKFLNADLDKASVHNERAAALLETENQVRIGVVQIAGLIARRIINDLKEGQAVAAGERFGIIRFGSRVDVYLPESVCVLVCAGQRAVGGETVLADLNSHGISRKGIAR